MQMHMSATKDGRVVALCFEPDSGDHAIIDDGEVEYLGTCRESAMAEMSMRGARQALDRASAEALLDGNDARCKALAESAQRVLDADVYL